MLIRRVEAGQQFVADDQKAGFIAAALERFFGGLLPLIVEEMRLQFDAQGGDVGIFARLVILLALGEDAGDHPLGFRASFSFAHPILHQIGGDHIA